MSLKKYLDISRCIENKDIGKISKLHLSDLFDCIQISTKEKIIMALLVTIATGSVGIMRYAHYNRNKFNTEISYKIARESKNWKQLEKNQSIFHQQGEKCSEYQKWISKNGSEIIYDSSGKIIHDPTNMGTYNFANPDTFYGIPHLFADIMPYAFFGNTSEDEITLNRFKTAREKLVEPEIQEVVSKIKRVVGD